MATNLVISGGPLHDFEASTAALVDVLSEAGVTSRVFDDPHAALAVLADPAQRWDLVTVNGLHGRFPADRHADLRARWSSTLGDAEAQVLDRHVRRGGGLLAMHTAVICFDGEPHWDACVGARWNWERSSHPELGPARIEPTAAGRRHPLTSGIEPFATIDEIYGFLDLAPDLVPLLTSPHGGVDHPLLWARTVGAGRVVTDLLGHDAAAITQADHREILGRAAQWLTEPNRSEPTP